MTPLGYLLTALWLALGLGLCRRLARAEPAYHDERVPLRLRLEAHCYAEHSKGLRSRHPHADAAAPLQPYNVIHHA